MCGLFGLTGPGVNIKDLKIIRDLGLLSQVRGTDGAGIYQVRSSAQRNWKNFEQLYKTSSSFSEMILEIEHKQLLREEGMRDFLDTPSVDVIIGHVRWATKGAINNANSHPFVFHNLVGAHNGTLRDRKYEDKEKTDSEMMFRDINERGLEAVLRDLDPWSAYAITMYDRDTKSMKFVRNEDRTLAFAVNENRSVVYWASEIDGLKYALKRVGEENIKCYNLEPFVLVDIDPTGITFQKVKNNPKSVFSVTTYDYRVKPSMQNGYGSHYVQRMKKIEENKKTEIVKVDPPKEEQKVLPFVPKEKKEKKTALKQFHAKCFCGKHNLNLLEIHLCERGKNDQFRKEGDNFYCLECDPIMKERAVE